MPEKFTRRVILAAIFILAVAETVQGRSFRVNQIPNGSVNSCSNCHINPGGGGTRNSFGQAVEAGLIGSNVDWGSALASLDSDGDGFTNGQELQDPNGTWTTMLPAPGNPSLVSKPGNAGSIPQSNSNPTLNSIGNRSVAEASTLSFALSASDPDGDSVTFTVNGNPSGSSLSGNTFTWTPGFSQSGTYFTTFTASDGEGGTDSETITITVSNTNRLPVLDPIGDQSIDEGSELTFTLTATDADGNTITFSISGNPAGSSLTADTFVWTPGFDQAGVYVINFFASDAQGSDSETVTVTVNDVNGLPELAAVGDRSVDEGASLSILLSASDPEGEQVT